MPEDQHDQNATSNQMPPHDGAAEPVSMTPASADPVSTPAATTSPEAVPARNNTLLFVAVLGGLIIVGGLIWYVVSGRDSGTESAFITVPEAQVVMVDPGQFPEVVAVVNGEELSNEAMAASVQNITREAQAQGLNPADETVAAQINEQAMVTLVNKTLLLQAANTAGITAAPERVESELTALETQLGGAEAFDTQIKNFGLTREQVRSDVVEQLVIDQYLSSNEAIASIAVSDSEIQSLYDQVAASGQQLPPLTEVRDQVAAQIQANKQQAAIAGIIDSLRAAGSIEILL